MKSRLNLNIKSNTVKMKFPAIMNFGKSIPLTIIFRRFSRFHLLNNNNNNNNNNNRTFGRGHPSHDFNRY